jgi:phosphoserine phosphatase
MDLDAKPADAPVPPLVVDLDGTLIQTDLLLESLFSYLGAYPFRMLSLASALSHGKASFKAEIAQYAAIEPARLPYDERVLSLIREARGNGRQVFLASASNERFVRDVAGYLGLFTGWFASTDGENLSSSTRAKRLVEVFGEKGFDYVGNDRADLPVWSSANRCLAVGPSSSH